MMFKEDLDKNYYIHIWTRRSPPWDCHGSKKIPVMQIRYIDIDVPVVAIVGNVWT